MPRLSKRNNNHGFHPGSAHACFLRTRRTFRVPFLTLPLGLGIVVEHPWFISCYYFMEKCGSISSLPSKSWQISNRFAFCSTDKFFRHQFCPNFSHMQMFWWNTMNRIFIEARFFCNHPDTQSAVFRHHNPHHFHILIICWRDWSSRTRVVFNIFSVLFESFVPLKNHSSR